MAKVDERKALAEALEAQLANANCGNICFDFPALALVRRVDTCFSLRCSLIYSRTNQTFAKIVQDVGADSARTTTPSLPARVTQPKGPTSSNTLPTHTSRRSVPTEVEFSLIKEGLGLLVD